jgi:hypothetical protein
VRIAPARREVFDLKGGSSGPASYALIFNPYKIIEWHHQHRTPGLREDKYNALMERAAEVGDESGTGSFQSAASYAASRWCPSITKYLSLAGKTNSGSKGLPVVLSARTSSAICAALRTLSRSLSRH